MSSLEFFYRINDMTITQTGQIEVDKESTPVNFEFLTFALNF